MNRLLTIVVAAIIVFGGWSLLKSRLLTPRQHVPATTAPAAAPSTRVIWTASGTGLSGGDDPRQVFSVGLNKHLGRQVSGASALPLDQIDPAVVSQTDEWANLAATVHGIRYHGKLQWGENGWTLVELSREE